MHVTTCRVPLHLQFPVASYLTVLTSASCDFGPQIQTCESMSKTDHLVFENHPDFPQSSKKRLVARLLLPALGLLLVTGSDMLQTSPKSFEQIYFIIVYGKVSCCERICQFQGFLLRLTSFYVVLSCPLLDRVSCTRSRRTRCDMHSDKLSRCGSQEQV